MRFSTQKPMLNNRRLGKSCWGDRFPKSFIFTSIPYPTWVNSERQRGGVRPFVGVASDPDVTSSHGHVGAWKWEGVGGQAVRDLQTGDNERTGVVPLRDRWASDRCRERASRRRGGASKRRAVAGGRKGLIVRPCGVGSPFTLTR